METTPSILRRGLVLGALGAGARPALAQPAWPSRPITLIVPFAAGGNVDTVGRLVAPELGRRLGQTVVVENAAGAGGVLGTERAARAAPDGHTLLLGVESTVVIAGLVSPKTVRYDGLRDFAPVALLAASPLVLVARPDLRAETLEELIRSARAQGRPLTYATSGIGTSLHLTGELIAQRAGIAMEHVPYRVSAQIGPDLMAGRVDLAVLAVSVVADLVRERRIKALAVSEAERSPLLPQVPGLAEAPALRDAGVTVWVGLFAPARTDPAIVARLEREAAATLRDDAALRERLAGVGTRPGALAGAEFAEFLRGERERFGAVVRANNISLD